MSSADYLHWEKVGDSVSAQRHMSDNDLAWAISMLQKPSTQPAEVHEMMIGLFLTMKTFEPMQKEKIRDAVLPLTNTRDPVEAKYVKVVLRRIDAV